VGIAIAVAMIIMQAVQEAEVREHMQAVQAEVREHSIFSVGINPSTGNHHHALLNSSN
jgi:hypothetical protein